jgi:hypothetical protein
MFHAGGWTFPYANVFSLCTQVLSLPPSQVTCSYERGLLDNAAND